VSEGAACDGVVPLYEGTATLLCRSKPSLHEGNLGLYSDKFFDGWGAQWEVAGPSKKDWLCKVAQEAGRAAGESGATADLLQDAAQRLRGLVCSMGGRVGEFSTVGRFVSGTGRPHPVDVGFAWQHTLGVPYLPGTSLKGVAREWAESSGEQASWVEEVFGSRDRVGSVVFFDALPTKVPKLIVEVLTSHYGGWGPDDPPGDWLSPVPVYFLAVEEGQPFLVAVAPRPGAASLDIERVWDCVVKALIELGAGAKTTAGFGQMHLIEDSGRVNTQEELQAPRSEPPQPRLAERLRARSGQSVYQEAQDVAQRAAEDPARAEEFVQALEEAGYLSAWQRGHKYKDEVSGPKKLRALAERLLALRGANAKG